MPDWGGGYTAEFGISEVNPDTWTASATVESVISLSKTASVNDSVPLIEQANLSTDADFEPGWYQLVMVTGPEAREKIGLGVMKFERTSSAINHGSSVVQASGFSVLKPADKMKVVAGMYAPKGADGAQEAAKLLRNSCKAPVVVEGGFTLASNVVYGIGMGYLEAAWLLLSAGGYCIQLGDDGVIYLREMPSEPVLELSRANADLLIPGVQDDFDISGIPNRYYAIEGGSIAVAVNDSADSAASFANTGEWSDYVDISPVRVNGETLDAYAKRKLAEMSIVTRSRTYSREYVPDVKPYSVVRGSLGNVGLDGDMVVTAQSFACGFGIVVQETAVQGVSV